MIHLTAADVTTAANVPDNKTYVPLTSFPSPSIFSSPSLHYMVADHGYDDKKLYEYSKGVLGIDLVCPSVEQYKSNSKERLELVCFYQSVLKAIYSQRRISIEPSLIEHIKSVFKIDQLSIRGVFIKYLQLYSYLFYYIRYGIP